MTISRASSTVIYPAGFMLVAAMNPCPCGFLGDPKRECSCTFLQVQRYRARISGPLMERIDLHIEVPPVPYKDLSGTVDGASCAKIPEKVMRARERLLEAGIHTNVAMNSRQINKSRRIVTESGRTLEKAIERFGLSSSAPARILKIARTIAGLEQTP